LNGSITVHAAGWSFELGALETILIPAVSGSYQVEVPNGAKALLAHAAELSSQ
jgi:hypothetical protein